MTSTILLNELKDIFFPDLYIFPDRWAPIDAYSKKYDLWIEVKVKDEFFPWVYVTEKKWKSMLEKDRCLYINGMRKDNGQWVFYSFSVHTLPDPKWEIIDNPNASNELYTGWIPTQMGHLHITKGKDLTNKLFINEIV
jgi:hypothetical protein